MTRITELMERGGGGFLGSCDPGGFPGVAVSAVTLVG